MAAGPDLHPFTPSLSPVQTGQVGPTLHHLLVRGWLPWSALALSVHPAVDAHSALCGLACLGTRVALECDSVCPAVPAAWGRAGVQEELIFVPGLGTQEALGDGDLEGWTDG